MNLTSSVAALPARVVPLPGESLVSLVRRTAAAMGLLVVPPLGGPRETG